MNELEKFFVSENLNLREALKILDRTGKGIIICIDSEKVVVGILTDGDFRRAILNGVSLDENIAKILNKSFFYLEEVERSQDFTSYFHEHNIDHIPVLKNGKLIEILFKDDLGKTECTHSSVDEKFEVVIMAGGQGTRLDPLTRIIPKPLLPIGKKAVIEVIIEKFKSFGIQKFHLSVNYKAKLIKAFFDGHILSPNINFVEEIDFWGTAGSISLLKGKLIHPFFITNCDIIINDDYKKISDFHIENKFDLTIIASLKHYQIPYGVCEIINGGKLKEIKEKPEYDLIINTGMYVMNPDLINLIPTNVKYDMTDHINKLLWDGFNIGVYPISENSWIDIGQWRDYENALHNF